MDTLEIEPRASRILSGCDTTTPRAHSIACATGAHVGCDLIDYHDTKMSMRSISPGIDPLTAGC